MNHRLSVLLNYECADALRRITAKRDISVTEAIRRAIGLLDYFEKRADAQCAKCEHPLDWHDPVDDGMCVKTNCYCQKPA